MKKIEIYIMELVLFISIIIFNFVWKSSFAMNLVVILEGVYAIARFGMMRDNNYTKSTITKMVISILLAFFITIYILGLLLGFHKTVASWNFQYIINVVVLEAIVIMIEEIIRYIICRNMIHQKIPVIIYSAILAFLNIIIEINGFDLTNHESVFIFITTIVAPVIAREAICSYLTYKVSYLPSLIYKELITMYQFILPIIPNLGNYLYAVSHTALPYIIFLLTRKTINYKENEKDYVKKSPWNIATVPLLALLLILVLLVSGTMSHTLIAIGSNSMKPIYERGDAIIYATTDTKKLQVGEIIAFKKEGKIITHRIINIQKKDSSYVIQTKGDANNAPDSFQVKEDEVLGVVKYSIKYLGYPTIWFNDLYTGKETS